LLLWALFIAGDTGPRKLFCLCSFREHSSVYQNRERATGLLHSVSPFFSLTGLGDEALDRQLDVLWHARQKATFVARDGVASHTKSVSEFSLSETEEEPLLAKAPDRSSGIRLPEGAGSVNVGADGSDHVFPRYSRPTARTAFDLVR
jgi:hypothetical protein